MIKIRTFSLLIPILLVSGCGWFNTYIRGEDNSLPAAELIDLEQPIGVDEIWDRKASSGTGEGYIKLLPAVDQNRIYVAGYKGDVAALAADSGDIIWETDAKLPISAGVGLGNDLVLIGSSEGEVIALYSSNGEEAWRAQAPSEILASPRAASGVVIVRSIDGTFTGYDARNGARLWAYSSTVPALTLRGTAPPILAQGAVITGLDTGKLLVLSLANGTPVWEKTIAPPRGRTELDRIVDIDAEPRVAGSTLYAAAYQGALTAIDLRNGNTLWSREFSSYTGIDADDSKLYITDESDAVWALDQRTGGSLWKQTQLSNRRLSAPVVGDGYVVVGDFEGYLHWLNRTDGKIVARVRADSEGIIASPIYHNGIFYILGNGGRLSAYRIASAS